MYRTIFDLATGQSRQIPLTEQEIADIQNAPKPVVVREIDKRRLRKALSHMGLLHTVKATIATLPESDQIDWEDATIIREDYSLVSLLATGLNLDIDAIFTLANSLE